MLKYARCGQKQASQVGLTAFCVRLCSTEAGYGLCSTAITLRSRQPGQPADLVEQGAVNEHAGSCIAKLEARALQQAVQHCLGQHRRGFREILVPVSQWGAGPTHDT